MRSFPGLLMASRDDHMNERDQGEAIPEKPVGSSIGNRRFHSLRAWPAALLALLMLAARFGPELSDDAMAKYWMISVFGPLLCCLLLLIWWLAASRATWRERVFGFLGLIASAAVALMLAHPTMRGPATTYLTLPTGLLLFAIATAFLRKASPATRTGTPKLSSKGCRLPKAARNRQGTR